jgi:hypothetical protein
MKQVAISFGLLITAVLVLFRIVNWYHLRNYINDETWITFFAFYFYS